MHNDHPQRRTTLRVPRNKHRQSTSAHSEPRQPRGHVATLKSWEGDRVGVLHLDGSRIDCNMMDADEFTITVNADDGEAVIFKHALKGVIRFKPGQGNNA